jgi:hypothetical protein
VDTADVVELAAATEHYRQIYNSVRPHEHLDFATPLSRCLAPPEPYLSET